MKDRPLRIGFDMDGVLLYNPMRFARPLIALAKSIFRIRKNGKEKFYYPKGKLELAIWKPLWSLLHTSSMFIAPGYNEVQQMIKEHKIEAYIITARYSFLQHDFEKWLKKLQAQDHFKAHFLNMKDEQPHLFKERMVKELDLDVFIEDNWDIVSHLAEKTKAKVFWIYNVLDKKIPYSHKFAGLSDAVKEIKKMVKR
jgi:hypothetical protein